MRWFSLGYFRSFSEPLLNKMEISWRYIIMLSINVILKFIFPKEQYERRDWFDLCLAIFTFIIVIFTFLFVIVIMIIFLIWLQWWYHNWKMIQHRVRWNERNCLHLRNRTHSTNPPQIKSINFRNYETLLLINQQWKFLSGW